MILTSPKIGSVEKDILALANQAIAHRGPDSDGFWISPCQRVAFAHRRLSIVDLSSDGHQPMQSTCGLYSVVFNGEIYNFREIRRVLEHLGREFKGSSDTQVLLAAYIEWGEECLQYFNGMFSFVIYDQSKGLDNAFLFLARDRAGEKPFYYSETRNGYSFASELKSIPDRGEIDLTALNYYLALGYVPFDLCLFSGVKKLPAGHCGRLELSTNTMSLRRYWTVPKNIAEQHKTPSILVDKAWELILDSVSLRLEADVPVGVLLSGGLDSSLVTAAAAHASSRPIETFTIALPGSKLDESHYAQIIASHFGTRHTVLDLDRPSLDILDGLAPFIDEPIADSSILPAWLVFGMARKKVTVALGGDGGDEIFGGYGHYSTNISDAHRLRHIPGSFVKATAYMAGKLPGGIKGRNRLSALRKGPYQQLIWGSPYFDVDLRHRIFTNEASCQLGLGMDAPENFLLNLFMTGDDPVDQMTRTDFGSILPDDFLVKVDRTSMAHSLEVRAPFLDHRLIEFGFSEIPSHWKVGDGESRRIQQLLAKKLLPSSLNTARKQGFSIPINEWLRAEGESRLMSRMEGLPSVIDMSSVRNLVRGHLKGRQNGGRLFALIMLAIAMRNLT
ncbi:asparagine synthase (glutamine-hydrolyzing) [Candidatus Njordibacter sp. Uisw_002]|uniref:asparagine synthase (glutamine-hydrolyzing) n=1 Tax=Candidatus Njordibacter sp. Uisw_002 TaxID=3230971 RepID=UPI003D51C448